jgi:hypothetical protein
MIFVAKIWGHSILGFVPYPVVQGERRLAVERFGFRSGGTRCESRLTVLKSFQRETPRSWDQNISLPSAKLLRGQCRRSLAVSLEFLWNFLCMAWTYFVSDFQWLEMYRWIVPIKRDSRCWICAFRKMSKTVQIRCRVWELFYRSAAQARMADNAGISSGREDW